MTQMLYMIQTNSSIYRIPLMFAVNRIHRIHYLLTEIEHDRTCLNGNLGSPPFHLLYIAFPRDLFHQKSPITPVESYMHIHFPYVSEILVVQRSRFIRPYTCVVAYILCRILWAVRYSYDARDNNF